MDEKVKQRPMKEIRRLVEEDNARFDDLAAAWQNLTVEEQIGLVKYAQKMSES